MGYVEVLKIRHNTVGRIFCDAMLYWASENHRKAFFGGSELWRSGAVKRQRKRPPDIPGGLGVTVE